MTGGDGEGGSGEESGDRRPPRGEREGPALADRRDLDRVYGPAEDSRLLAETAVEYVDDADLVLDVGTGSGFVADRVGDATGARVVGSDLNPLACRRASAAGVPVVRADLASAFRESAFDVVLFNPPYLPTDPGEEWDNWMAPALSGGADGRAVVDPFLADVRRVLTPGGRAYLLVSTLTGPDAVRATAAANGLEAEQVASESYPFERLIVLELRPSGRTPPRQ